VISGLGTMSSAKIITGTMRTAPISRTAVAAPRTSAPAATSGRPGRLRQSSSTRPAVIMVSNAASGMMVCSSWSW
jgi:hypothetical protein